MKFSIIIIIFLFLGVSLASFEFYLFFWNEVRLVFILC